MSKRILATIATAVITGSLVSCSDEPENHSESIGEIAIITVDPWNPYWSAQVTTAENMASQMGYRYTTRAHNNDPDEQVILIETAIENNVDGILLDPAGGHESIEMVEAAVDAGIPVTVVNAELAETGLADAQVVSDNAQGAALGAEIWAEAMDFEGTYVELIGEPSDNNAHVRSDEYESVLSEYPDLEKVGEEIANWDRQQGRTAMEELLSDNPDIDGVVSGNDEMALGAISALREADLIDEVEVLGFDGSDEAVDAISDGVMVATVLQPITDVTTQAMEILHEVIQTGESPFNDEIIFLDCILIDEENADLLIDFELPG